MNVEKMDLGELKCRFGFRQPDRGLEKESDDVKWRYGKKPNYTKADTRFLKGKTQNHKAGNISKKVISNLYYFYDSYIRILERGIHQFGY
jgi:hypothetical protein